MQRSARMSKAYLLAGTAAVAVWACGGSGSSSGGSGSPRAETPGKQVERRGPSGQAAAGAPAAYPGPGWRFASPRTGITFRAVGVERLRDLRVVGSASGAHRGRVRPLPRGLGAVFTPDVPFAPGERVEVTAGVRVAGARGRTFSFTTSRPWHARRRPSRTTSTLNRLRLRVSRPEPGGCRLKRRRFRTLPHLRPVALCMARGRRAPYGQGKLLVTPTPAPVRLPGEQFGVMLVSNRGKLLWYSPRPYRAHDAKTVVHGGRRLLVFYQSRPRRRGYYELRDERYRVVSRIRAGNGYLINSHEIVVTARGTAFVSAYERVSIPGVGGVVDYVVQEVDLTTRDVLFEWHALDHVPPSASFTARPRRGSWDYFHGNSIEPARRGGNTILVSARNTSAVYGIHRVTGALQWTLGGKRDDFGLPARHRFCAQHDARWTPGGDVSVFDNGGTAQRGGARCPRHPARVQVFRLSPARKAARLVRNIRSEPLSVSGRGYFPGWVGNAVRQPNGNMLISWGTTGQITEITPQGGLALRMRLGRWTYRAFRAPWTGRPPGRPAVEASRRRGVLSVWASWNGATEVKRWRLLAGASRHALAPVGPAVAFADLETRIRVRSRARAVAVRALDARGRTLGQSRVVRVSRS